MLTNMPTRSSSAALATARDRGADGDVVVPPDSRASSTASAACTTMNRVASCSRASRGSSRVQIGVDLRSGGRRHGTAGPAGRGRSVGQFELLGQAGQAVAPVGSWLRASDSGSCLVTEDFALPQGVVGVLDGSGAQAGVGPAARAA